VRHDRFSGKTSEKPDEFRTPFQRDCDRILYSGAFRRLAVVRQVVSPAGGHAFHNRLTHALKVAQVGRRIAEKFIATEKKELLESVGGIDPNVVEAAGLAHDLGHPPFGHIAEETLDKLLRDRDEADGYEGNAQSFRIVTRLEIREAAKESAAAVGLDLTRATLNAMFKYPRLRPLDVEGRCKFGAYRCEEKQLEFARGDGPQAGQCCTEAQIMDWADDITYAVHDFEDFYRVGLIPLGRLTELGAETQTFIEARFGQERPDMKTEEREQYAEAAVDWFRLNPVTEAYNGSRTQRAALRGVGSSIIHEAICGTSLSANGIVRPQKSWNEVVVLKELTWHFVIDDPRMATEQFGKKRVIERLFEVFNNAALDEDEWNMFPVPIQEQLAEGAVTPLRTIADYIASLGEQRAVELDAELQGLPLKPLITGVAL
jgi:dGTPase